MNGSDDWEAAGKAAQSQLVSRIEAIEQEKAARKQAVEGELTLLQISRQQSLALLGEIKNRCIEIAARFNTHIEDEQIRMNVVEDGANRFSIIKGRRGRPRASFEIKGANQIAVHRDDWSLGRRRITWEVIERNRDLYLVNNNVEGGYRLTIGSEVITPQQVAEKACIWLVNAQGDCD